MRAALASILAGLAVLVLDPGGRPHAEPPAPSAAEIDLAVAQAEARADFR